MRKPIYITLLLVASASVVVACSRGSARSGGTAEHTDYYSHQVPASAHTSEPASGGRLVFSDGFENGRVDGGWNAFLLKTPQMKHAHQVNLPPAEKAQYFLDNSPSAEIERSNVKSGNSAIKFIVTPEDAVTSGDRSRGKQRAEFERYGFGREGAHGSEQIYEWSIYIPQDMQCPRPGREFLIIGQWHQSLNGMSPLDKRAGWAKPPISVTLRSNQKLGCYMQLLHGLKGEYQSLYVPVERGRWLDMKFHIRWSKGDDGFVKAWQNGTPLQTKRGDTILYGANIVPHNERANSFKIGIYRGGSQQNTVTLYYDDVAIYER